MRKSDRRAVVRPEIIVLVVCAIVAVVVGVVLLKNVRRPGGFSAKESAMLRGIHQSWVIYSREFGGSYPVPGLVRRLPEGGVLMPGHGEEDVSQNTTANLFSLCIAGNYFTPEMCVGSTEPSHRVKVLDSEGYDYQQYQPSEGIFWDTNFKADLHVLSNVSYAHRPITGELENRFWRDSLDASVAVVGNRGPLGGIANANSITNKIYSPQDSWNGNIVYGDNSVSFTSTVPATKRPNGLGYVIAPECQKEGTTPLNSDADITFTKEMTDSGPVIQHD